MKYHNVEGFPCRFSDVTQYGDDSLPRALSVYCQPSLAGRPSVKYSIQIKLPPRTNVCTITEGLNRSQGEDS